MTEEAPEYFSIVPAIHLNSFEDKRLFSDIEFDIKDVDNQHIIDNLELLFDGTIIGVRKESMVGVLNDSDIKGYRLGYLKPPSTHRLSTSNDFYRFLAIRIPIGEFF